MKMFQIGRVQYGEKLPSVVTDEEINLMINKFSLKYWGNVDKQTWAENEMIIADDTKEGGRTGAIKGKYLTSSNIEVNLIREPNRQYLFILSNEDIESSFMDEFFEKIRAREEERRVHHERMRNEIRERERRERRDAEREVAMEALRDESFDILRREGVSISQLINEAFPNVANTDFFASLPTSESEDDPATIAPTPPIAPARIRSNRPTRRS